MDPPRAAFFLIRNFEICFPFTDSLARVSMCWKWPARLCCRWMGKKAEQPNKKRDIKRKSDKKRRVGRKKRLAKACKSKKKGSPPAAPPHGLETWKGSGQHITKSEKDLLVKLYNNIKIMRKKRIRGADAADEFQALTSISYPTIWKWQHPQKKKQAKLGPDGLAEAAEEDPDHGGFSDDDIFGDIPLIVGGRSMGAPIRRGPTLKDPRLQCAQSRMATCES